MLWWRSKPRRFALNKPVADLAVETVRRSPATFNALLTALFTLSMIAILNWGVLAGTPTEVWARLGGYVALVTLSALVIALYLDAFHPEVLLKPKYLFGWCFSLLCPFALVKIFLLAGWPLQLVPVTLVGMLLAVSSSTGLAIANLLIFTLLTRLSGLLTGPEYHAVLALFPGSAIAIFGLSSLRRRSRVLNVGIVAGVVHAFTLVGIDLVSNPWTTPDNLATLVQREAGLGLVNGVASGFIVTGVLPFLERFFQILTPLSLLEWSDFNQPLLKKLSLEAPGTHYHSIRVSEIAEAAAAAIGADALLTRVGCLYHDIGKTNKPEYFVENEATAGSRHKNLSPAMSTLIIKAHVKDGVEMAEYYGLPREVVDFIPQHHGNMLIEYFYKEALSQAEEAGTGAQVDIDSFRYPGPKPQRREAAIAMLADGVEASARTLTDPTPQKLEGLVRDIAMRRLNDGQFAECSLTMKELEEVVASFVRTLVSIYHSRIRYPDQTPEADLDRPRTETTRISEKNARD